MDAIWLGSKDRLAKKSDSPADFFNYVTAGISGTVIGTITPEEPFSKEHWLDSFGLATIGVGGGRVAKSKSTSGISRNDQSSATGGDGQKNSGVNPKIIDELEGPVINGKRVGSGEKIDDIKPVWGRDEKGRPFITKEFPHVSKEHGFSDVIDNYSRFADEFSLVGGDRIKRSLFQIEGSNNGKEGVFEWIVEPNGNVSHRRFIEEGILTGYPNQTLKK